MEKQWDLRDRTKSFAIAAIRVSEQFPHTEPGRIIRRQFVRSATSIGANYRAARMARSKAEFTSKLQIALEEADEAAYWLELMDEVMMVRRETAETLHAEARELTAILMSSLKKARGV